MSRRQAYQFHEGGSWHLRRDSQGGFLTTLCGLQAVETYLVREARTAITGSLCKTCLQSEAGPADESGAVEALLEEFTEVIEP